MYLRCLLNILPKQINFADFSSVDKQTSNFFGCLVNPYACARRVWRRERKRQLRSEARSKVYDWRLFAFYWTCLEDYYSVALLLKKLVHHTFIMR